MWQIGLVAVCALLFSQLTVSLNRQTFGLRQRRHRVLKWSLLMIFFLSFVPYYFVSSAYSSESIAISSIFISLFVALVQPVYAKVDDRLHVHIAIPSVRPFNNAIRNGLFRTLVKSNFEYEVTDSGVGGSSLDENHASLTELVNDAIRQRADVVICHAATAAAAQDEIFTNSIFRLVDRGAVVFLIENFPKLGAVEEKRVKEAPGSLVMVRSDSIGGATSLADYIASQYKNDLDDNSSTVIHISGPISSRNASERREVFLEKFAGQGNVIDRPGSWWGFAQGRDQMSKALHELPTGDNDAVFVIAGNDEMALGICAAIDEVDRGRSRRYRVFGYDGISPALHAIAQKECPFEATVHLSPETYGVQIGEAILDLVDTGFDRPPNEIVIKIDASKIRTKAQCARELGYA